MIIIGNGRVGSALVKRAQDRNVRYRIISRNAGWVALGDPEISGPILVATNAGDINSVIDAVPADRRSDLVFTQNGMIDDTLARRDLKESTRGLLYFAVAFRGDEITPGGSSIFTGPHSETVATWFQQLELEAGAVPRGHFSNEMFSKLIWNCVFGLMCDVFDLPVGELVTKKRNLIDSLVSELTNISNFAGKATLSGLETAQSLCAYSMSIPTYKGSLKQWEWRNGWFVDAAQAMNLPTPVHSDLLASHGNNPMHKTV